MILPGPSATVEAADRFAAKADRYVPMRGCLYVFGSGEEHFVMPGPDDERVRRTPAGLELDLRDALAELDRQGRRILVLSGEAGMGKTTFLQALCADVERNEGRIAGRRVFYADAPPVMALARRSAGEPAVQWADVFGGAPRNVCFLLDGLDWEASGVEEAVRALEAMAEAWPEAHFVVTSRPSAQASARFGSSFLEVRLLGLNRTEQERLVERVGADKERVQDAIQTLGARPDGAFLVRNPFLLGGLCRWIRGGDGMPDEMDALLEACVRSAEDETKASVGEVLARRLEELSGTTDASPSQNGAARSERGGVPLVSVPAGTFRMGSPDDEPGRWADEGPVHEVHVPGFYLAPVAVTNGQYAAFLEAHPETEPPPYWGDPAFGRPGQPVVGLGWDEARRFAVWAGGRLPTEAEWEYACRAGTEGLRYGELDETGWYRDTSGAALHPVGRKAPNAWGLHDLLGNAWEWVEDDYHAGFEGAPDDGSAWCEEPRGEHRILRGGSWADSPRVLRAATRLKDHPGPRIANVGVRLARSASPERTPRT